MDEPVRSTDDDPVVDPLHRNNAFVRSVESFVGWLQKDSPNSRLFGALSAAAFLLIATIGLALRGPEIQEKPVEVVTKAQVVATTVQKGEDLGTIGARYGRSRIEVVGMNIPLLEANTAKCGERRSGVCRRDDFGEKKDLAFDAVWPGDVVYVIPSDALAAPSLASNAR